MTFNTPFALVIVGFATALGALLGSWLIGVTVGLGIILALVLFLPAP